jgi:hypothetical protein
MVVVVSSVNAVVGKLAPFFQLPFVCKVAWLGNIRA